MLTLSFKSSESLLKFAKQNKEKQMLQHATLLAERFHRGDKKTEADSLKKDSVRPIEFTVAWNV